MTIMEIQKEIDAKKNASVKAKQVEAFNWKPTKAENFAVPDFEPPKLTKPNRKKLGKVLAFIEMTKRKRFADGCTIMPIPTTSKKLVDVCGNKMEVSRMINFMLDMGLLEMECEDFQYNADQEAYNTRRTYRYYYDNEKHIEEYCKKNGIHKYIVRNNIYDTVGNKKSVSSIDSSQVKINSKLCLVKPDDFSVARFEQYLMSKLYKNYPQLERYQSIADEINDKYYAQYPEMQLRFVPKFTWDKRNKAVKKIGIRCTNAYVSAKKDVNDNEKYNGYYKEEILNEYSLFLEKDVKSSVPRITLFLNMGMWIKEDVDIYESIYKAYQCEEKDNNDTVGNSFSEMRDSVKALHMRGYFDNEKRLGVNTRRAMLNVYDKDAVDREMKRFQKAIQKAEGGHLYDSEIFLHESCIYLDVLQALFEQGFFVWQCYDAFYAKKDGVTQEEFEILVADLVEEKANAYIEAYRDSIVA